MEFRPCIDIHDGKVKQIVGGSLSDSGATTNFESNMDAKFYAKMYHDLKLTGGHIILLNPPGTRAYREDMRLAFDALKEYPGELQIGGGVNIDNAKEFIDAGASHIIVTSCVFKDGKVNYDNLKKLVDMVSAKRIVLDLSCRKQDNNYMIVTDRWQKFTREEVNEKTLDNLSGYCDEFLVHAADVEGKCNGIEENLVKILSNWGKKIITYAGGIGNYDDIYKIKKISDNAMNVTVGSALDIFGGKLDFKKVVEICRE